MMNVYVCIGSSCHQKSSYSIMKELKSLIDENGLEDKVSLNSAFCLGHCAEGVTMKIDEDIITGVGLGNIEDVFRNRILKVIR
ncbi:MAG: NAD(P)H-dependent oxidoreductase subunit E [Oscillospiraceae bacterium]|nr:NAD(P)H-dependent oxidoreductase subunit E [Oscillospiraceae bacterium]